ncbi:MAG: DUF1343 domain-containing protein [Pseudomonadota bacterium]|nr:DUF1343 domain-containing protein [Pseudomonadota bacterium]
MSNFQLGIDQLIKDPKLKKQLAGQRVALVAHPASVTSNLEHSLDVLSRQKGIKFTSAFGAQHGMRGEKQDNMIESADYQDPEFNIPVFSLYGKVRKPSTEMMSSFDLVLFDLQDVGTRIYTFLTTLLYMLEACAKNRKEIWVLDRPNPAGRTIEGKILETGWESFVGAGPLPIRHGLTLGEAALWFKTKFNLDVNLKVIKMKGYNPDKSPGFGWPNLSWVNPSPNASNLSMVRCFAGTVLIEGTTLSEGRGTTRPLEVIGAPGLPTIKILKEMERLRSKWLDGCRIRRCFFEPTFQKHKGNICEGIQIHVDDRFFDHQKFKPYRLVSLFLKSLKNLRPDYEIWRKFEYEYETEHLAIDLINGGPSLREFVDDKSATVADFESLLAQDEKAWAKECRPFLLY